ncbi:Bacterial extracellular solute-binding protein, family 3 [Streptomyces sp. MP131-18]|nr:Bacterial extracellular solute-binding protein, family 3 [Streptomyces sp. MP131-18]
MSESSENTVGLEALRGGSVVTWRSSELVRRIDEATTDCGQGISVEGIPDQMAMSEAVSNGDADGALINYPTAVYETGSGDEAEGLVIAGKQLDVVPFGIGGDANERGLRDAVQEAVQTLMTTAPTAWRTVS